MEKYHENGNKLAHVLLQTATIFMLPPLNSSPKNFFLIDPRTIWNYNILYIPTAKLNTKGTDLPSTPNR